MLAQPSYSMEHSPWEGNNRSASTQTEGSLPLTQQSVPGPTPSHLTSFKICSSTYVWVFKVCVPSRFSTNKFCARFSFLPRVLYTSQSNPPWIHRPNNACWKVQIMKSPTLRGFLCKPVTSSFQTQIFSLSNSQTRCSSFDGSGLVPDSIQN
jgi:hypothetical protein